MKNLVNLLNMANFELSIDRIEVYLKQLEKFTKSILAESKFVVFFYRALVLTFFVIAAAFLFNWVLIIKSTAVISAIIFFLLFILFYFRTSFMKKTAYELKDYIQTLIDSEKVLSLKKTQYILYSYLLVYKQITDIPLDKLFEVLDSSNIFSEEDATLAKELSKIVDKA